MEKLSGKKLYNQLCELEEHEIKTLISASIEFLINGYGVDFNKFIKEIKKVHKKVNKMNKKIKIKL